ncbi:MAG: aminotransferase class V-fold PLP-dependent enzyme [Kineosporiaceae bacterium]|nr:aminotransferase class V-fold PLP-dependent enzyme [Kineosporiaceae bacterium]
MSVTTLPSSATLSPTSSPVATVCDDLLVPTLNGPVDFANLDHAASTPALAAVKDAVDRTLRTYSSVHRGNGYASRVTSRWYELARAEIAAFVGARRDDSVIFTRTTTDSWALLAHALPAHTAVFVFATEHHSTLLPWGEHRTVTLPIPGCVPEALGTLEAALAADAATSGSQHRLVVLCGASNVTGEIWPIERFVRVARRYGARVAVDAAQLAPHRRIDLAEADVDYVAFSGHKLYAPFGTGVLAGRADWLDAAAPYLVGGGATSQVRPGAGAPRATWAAGAARHEGGSPNVIGAVALAAACSTLRRHWSAVERYEATLTARLREGLEAIPGVRTWSIFDRDSVDRVGVVAFTVAGLDSGDVSATLSFEHGIGVRDGKFCAHLLTDHLLAAVPQGTAVRASVGLATTTEHVERLIAAVAELAERVRRDPAGWVPPADPGAELEAPRPW